MLFGASAGRIVKNPAFYDDSELVQSVTVVTYLRPVGWAGAGRGLYFMHPSVPVKEVKFCCTEIDGGVPGVTGFVYGLAKLDCGAEMFRPDSAQVQPELSGTVVEVFDVHAADVFRVDHMTTPGS